MRGMPHGMDTGDLFWEDSVFRPCKDQSGYRKDHGRQIIDQGDGCTEYYGSRPLGFQQIGEHPGSSDISDLGFFSNEIPGNCMVDWLRKIICNRFQQ